MMHFQDFKHFYFVAFRAVYCVVGRCDGREDHSEVVTSTDDYLWMKLGQVTFDEAEGARDRLTMTQLQTMLLEEFGNPYRMSLCF